MRAYRFLFNIERKLLVNNIRAIIQSPKRLITYALYLVFMTWVIMTNMKNVGNGSSQEALSIYEIYFKGGAFLLILFMGYGLLKKSTMAFRMSEINLLFTAPVDSRKLLIFNVLKKIPTYLLTSIYTLVFILSIMIRMYHPSLLELLVTCIGYTMVLLILEPISFCMFVISTKIKKEEFASNAVKAFFLVIVLMALVPVAMRVMDKGFSAKSVFDGLGSVYLNYIPVIGWGRFLTTSVIDGISSMTYLALTGMFVMYGIFLAITFKLGDDYYEDVIITSEERHQKVKEYKEGKSNLKGFQLKKKKVSKTKFKKGAGALNWKRQHMLKRTDVSAYFSMETLICLALAIGGMIFMKDPDIEAIYFVTGLFFYAKFLFSMETELDRELKKPFYYLIPDTAMRKVLSIISIDLMRFFINVSLIAGLYSFFNFKMEYIILPFAVTLMYTVMLLSSYLFNMFLPSEDFKRLILMFKMLQMLIVVLPSIIVMIIVGVISESVAMVLLSAVLINLLIAGIILGLSEVLFMRLELK